MTAVAHTEVRGSAHGLDYLLYLPADATAAPPPLLVMLHGCLQDAASFRDATYVLRHAAGTAVLFAEQPATANPQRCWNWFDPAHQHRDAGEPRRIAGLTQSVVAERRLAEDRVYVAGISAGGMMAAIVAGAYPDVYAALGIHSAGAFPTATSVAEALAVMRGDGVSAATAAGGADAALRAMNTRVRSMPVVIVHGTADAVVNVANAEQAAHSWWRVHAAATGASTDAHVTRSTGAAGGRAFVTESFSAAAHAAAVIESWLVTGLGHAWSGGVAGGSYADAAGPDAAQIMLRFLLQQRRP